MSLHPRRDRRESLADPERALDLRFETILDALYFEGKRAGPERGVSFIDDEGVETRVGYLAALEKSVARAAVLRARGVVPGERVVLLLPTERDVLYLFFGLHYAGAVPAPLAPPASFADLADLAPRLQAVMRLLGARRIVTAEALRPLVLDALPGAQVLVAEELRREAQGPLPPFTQPPVRAEDAALIQCTSGSTGAPKGVVLTHENLISNVHQIGRAVSVRPDDVTVSWLPLYHDMGLIGCLLFALVHNLDAVFLSPLAFLRRPASWLEAMARHGGSLTSAPNFAYGLTASRATDAELASLGGAGPDLSRWRVACCGAEPIDERTLRRFTERFARAGLPSTVMAPCYGLAEATLAVTFHEVGAPLVVDRIERDALASRGEAVPARASDVDAISVVSCGAPVPGTRLSVVDASFAALPEGRVGRILVQGPSVMKGYWGDAERTRAALLPGGWLDTGDLGYLSGGALRITGRAKDLVIIRGRKYAPTDFERAAEEVAGVRRGAVVAFGHHDAAQGTEALVLVCESDAAGGPGATALADAVAARVSERTGIRPARVAVVARDALTKTTSGKLQRARTRERWVAGELS